MYRAFTLVPGAVFEMMKNRRKHLVGADFVERLQLAVTEVNGCAACSYAHTYLALQRGMSNEEIAGLLLGDENFLKQEEARAVLFAQHYADSRGFPKKSAFESIVGEYGVDRARVILASAQLMMAGNIYGIPYSAFVSRLRGRPYEGSSLIYELGMQLAGFVLLPITLIHGLFQSIAVDSTIRMDDDENGLPESG